MPLLAMLAKRRSVESHNLEIPVMFACRGTTKFALAALCAMTMHFRLSQASGSLRSKHDALQNEDTVFWERNQFDTEVSSFPIEPPSLAPGSSNPSPPSSPGGDCEITVTIGCTESGLTDMDCASIPLRTTDCIVQLTYVYNVINLGADPFEITSFLLSSEIHTENITEMFGTQIVPPGETFLVSNGNDVDFCVDGNFIIRSDVEAKNSQGNKCNAFEEYELDVMKECKVNLEISCSLTEGLYVGEDCRTMAKWSPDGCVTDVEYKYEISNIGADELRLTKLESVLNGESFDLLEELNLMELVISPFNQYVVRRNVTLEACMATQYILTGTVAATTPLGQECDDVDDFAIDIPPITPSNQLFASSDLRYLSPPPSPYSSPSDGSSLSSNDPSSIPSGVPSRMPSDTPSVIPSDVPSTSPSVTPSSIASADQM